MLTKKNGNDSEEFEVGQCPIASDQWAEKQNLRVFGQQYPWERDQKPTLMLTIGTSEVAPNYWQMTPAKARQIAKMLTEAAEFIEEFEPHADQWGGRFDEFCANTQPRPSSNPAEAGGFQAGGIR